MNRVKIIMVIMLNRNEENRNEEILRKITFITGNQHKVKEAQGIFNHFQIEVEHVDLGYRAFWVTLRIYGLLSESLSNYVQV